MKNIILLTWLHNIYLQPFKFRANNCSATLQTLLHLGYIGVVPGYLKLTVITPKGKKFLQRNITDLHDAWKEEEILSTYPASQPSAVIIEPEQIEDYL